MKIWLDCSNSPHPLLFAPVARELAERGHEVAVTVRDHAQTVELARERWPAAEVVDGRRVSVARAATAVELATRVIALGRWARRTRPDVALSHNSYAQIAAARALGIPALTAMDYEHQPANHLAFRLARRILLPEIVPARTVERQGARPSKVRRYDGLKEELYLADFEPDPHVLERLGVARGNVLVVARSGATRAAYHGYEDRLLSDALARLARRPDVTLVVLARHPEHRRELESLGGNVIVPREAVDSRSLLREADVFLGAGGTMTREAALLGIPTLSLFGGKQAAADQWLERAGRLRRLVAPEQVDALGPRPSAPVPLEDLRARSDRLVGIFVSETLALGGNAARRDAGRLPTA
jgi:predicted glycosyltransferase